MFRTVKQCAGPMTRLRRLNINVTLHGHVIYHSICVRSLSPEPLEGFFY